MAQEVCLFWFRRDLRIEDNAGLFSALKSGYPVLPLFIFDSEILNSLPEDDARVSFIHQNLQRIRESLKQSAASSLAIFQGKPGEVFQNLLETYDVKSVYTNEDYEPYALKRDSAISALLADRQIPFISCKDQVVFAKDEITKDDGNPYVVYTPYMRKWKASLEPVNHLQEHNSQDHLNALIKDTDLPNLSLEEIGFRPSEIQVPPYKVDSSIIDQYGKKRDFPAVNGTSRLGPHLRFGTVSIRHLAKKALRSKEETFLNELIWREFFMQILWHFPRTVHESFKKQYDNIVWRNDQSEFEKWKEGKTGYALVDAGMRELNATGYMHNRVRMLVASFLCKHLLIDWRWGEAYFAEKLLDFELSSNVGNWQWASGSGVDAAPYFRIFNPMTQIEKFDKQRRYIKRWVPEFETEAYPEKIVDHKMARERCLETYKAALN
ncbi:cryptochrome/photolyase family protein [Lentiprolixibacter aurantiacus]|uniref:Deoxyribodipyrimidine photo-lyase n=1 Tax=Lentiprolixibacter aurantiacus TaxID=2993939 RepID=A0AAE3SP35_9FLAO|nr:deoxyribodipyrimidine photo-lyase [Lentiprolixibacter aurantiacus]MCX2719791.1 deoxyribodipyrimidine photo-lyase [Lentiprolixibacter aurantiacus]